MGKCELCSDRVCESFANGRIVQFKSGEIALDPKTSIKSCTVREQILFEAEERLEPQGIPDPEPENPLYDEGNPFMSDM
jgi:hypothetical protein